MARSILLLLAGAIAGATAVYFFVDQEAEPRALSLAGRGEPSPTIDTPLPASVEPDASLVVGTANVTAARVAVYEQAVQLTDALDLELMIDLAAAAPRSRSRDLELQALLARLAEIDPERAVQFAQSSFSEVRNWLPYDTADGDDRSTSGADPRTLGDRWPCSRRPRWLSRCGQVHDRQHARRTSG